jgi:phosphatidylinositol alpha-1,6-mannosyltransferase
MRHRPNKVLFLTLSTFSDTGGIQKVCRTLSKTLNDLMLPTGHLQVFSLCDHTYDIDPRYLAINNFKGFNYQRWWFSFHSLMQSLTAKVIILSHINLLPIACIIKVANPKAQIIFLIHGIEVWRPISGWKINFLNKYCLIWSVSKFTARKTQELHGLSAKNICVLPNCLDPFFHLPYKFEKPAHLFERYKIESNTHILLGINRLTCHEHEKGYDQVLNVMPALLKIYPNICYLLAGKADPSEVERLNAKIVDRNLQQHVKLIGYINDEELSDHYLLADIFLLISKKEGFGLVLLEAAACGCKIICGNIDGSSEAVLFGKMGTQVNPRNKRQLELAILASLQNKQENARALDLQKMCMEHFSFASYNKKVKQQLTQFINLL